MTFYLQTDEYDSMESMGNEHESSLKRLKATVFDAALIEARETFANMKRYKSGPDKWDQEFPRNPMLCVKL